jgi:NADH:ubiquinone oxidoreductase subunit C
MNITELTTNDLFAASHRIMLSGSRLLGIFWDSAPAKGLMLRYFFEKNGELECFEVRTKINGTVQSISELCGAAEFYENEIRDLTGIEFEGITLDFQKRFLLSEDPNESGVD